MFGNFGKYQCRIPSWKTVFCLAEEFTVMFQLDKISTSIIVQH